MGFRDSLAAFARGMVPGSDATSSFSIESTKQSPAFSGGSGFGLLDGFFPNQHIAKRGTREVLTSYERAPWINGNVGKLADDIAGLTWRVFVRRNANGKAVRDVNLQLGNFQARTRAMEELRRRDINKAAGSVDELQEIVNHPLTLLLSLAHTGPEEVEGLPKLDGWQTFFVTQATLDLKDESFWLLEKNNAGRPMSIWVLPPTWITQIPTESQPFWKLSFGSVHQEVPASEIIWFKRPTLLNPYGRGSGTGVALGDEIETDEYAAKHQKAWFYNKSIPALLIGIKGASAPEVKEAKQKWDEDNRGFWRAFRTHFYRGELDVKQLSIDAKKSQLNETRLFQRDIIRQVYRLPPELVGDVSNSNRATISAAEDIHARGNLIPRAELLRRAMQLRLAPLYDDRIIVHYDSPVPSDKVQELAAMKAQPLTPEINEWRRAQGLPPKKEFEGMHAVPSSVQIEPGESDGDE